MFSPHEPVVPGSFNMVEIVTGGDRLLRRLQVLCGELARGERTVCDLIRELPAEGDGVSELHAYHGKTEGQKTVTITPAPGDPYTAQVDWRNTADEWNDVAERIGEFLGTPAEKDVFVYLDDNDAANDGTLSVER